MINPHDSIRFTNVISKKFRFHYHEMNTVMNDFFRDVAKFGVTMKGPFFYSINNVPMDEMVNAELFMPIREDTAPAKENFEFHSYFSIEDMASICLHKEFEKNTQVAYHMLLTYIEESNLRQATPIFHVVSGDENFRYMFIKIGYAPKVSEKITN
ncbi:DUF5085 family protein [Bacillus timonensis]|uniref:DUF5085 family protein n=1 Tax=Bacillus timonensis TaxID=1033734 RepID=A0A4S3PS82_9BACI|nr:DUF5085 family protein [Bacillus timonensis]THE12418.1 DUF5085 family protein [Bacillus timonensis]